jgi:hypothetical protein
MLEFFSTTIAVLLFLPFVLGATVETDWIEVFRAGSYPQGTFTADDIASIADGYDPENVFEAPGSVDHQQQGLAYGWVSDLKAEGEKLFAKFRQVPEAFAKAIKEGRVKNRSIELFRGFQGNDLYLKAVSWLGVKPPQVTGMEDPSDAIEQFDHSGLDERLAILAFEDEGDESEEGTGEDAEDDPDEEGAEDGGEEPEEDPDSDPGEEQSIEEPDGDVDGESGSGADDDPAGDDTEEFSRQAQSEIERLRRQNQQLQQQLDKSEQEGAREEFEQFCEERVPPAVRDEVLAIFESLHRDADSLHFSHEDYDTPVEAFKQVVDELSLAHLFNYDPEPPTDEAGTSPDQLEDAVRDEMSGVA